MATSASVITERNAAADLGIMGIRNYVHLLSVTPARLSGHHSKSAWPIPAERK